MVNSTFIMNDAKRILGIPLAKATREGFLVWKGEAFGSGIGIVRGLLMVEVEGDALTVIRKMQKDINDR
ncbi:hypothetical protein J1N35_038280 [Gossypium stocksii]|uniref:Uncharacterized protein n=1 Tax=Gossypium stocksii TaxID=47602 RepID=A0A9D3ULP6_9ROSI|nr:hypothetical protein J1N35_038280 [Gossypium stocksii]